MGKFVTFCSLLMGGVILACNWLYPESVISWFAAPGEQFIYLRSVVLALVAAILVLEVYADLAYVRRLAGLVGAAFLYGTVQFWLDHPVYVFDALFLASVSVCFGLLALQRAGEQRELPPVPALISARRTPAPVRVQAVSMFERLQDLQYRKHRLKGNFTPVSYINDLNEDGHRLTVNLSGDEFRGRFRGGGAAVA
jgi:hypothetical protein